MSRLDERQRRWLAAVEANRIGRGGTEHLRTITGLDINTIRRGRQELASAFASNPSGRIREIGGGRKRLEKK
ncbi:MAG: transposase [Leptolyngbya foveolarum]|uniref:Transposase n=1 Tax=Leptolyngbya foveolarum TaxID=47253 RepID=A0A2W4VBN8_9CYAN|nr:MAG: transposase [Leptolyngbya foveolarum]